MGFYEDRILPRAIDRMCGVDEMVRWRRVAIEGLDGTVVEIGFGSGLNAALYPEQVDVVHAVEPNLLAWKLAARRIDGRVVRVGLDGQSIPLADDSCDAALSTFTLCTIPDVERAIAEVARVLKPGGRLHFLEHGRAPDARVLRWQRRIEPLQKKLAGGCHLTRDTVALLEAGGFDVDVRKQRYARGPKPWSYFTVGTATLTV